MKPLIISEKSVGEWVSQKAKVEWHPFRGQALGLKRDELVAGVIYENWNGVSVSCHIAIEGRLTPYFLYAIFHYPFEHLKAKKILVTVIDKNEKSKKLVEKMGFRKEYQLLDAHPDGAILVYSMTKDQCRFIGERYGNQYGSQCEQGSTSWTPRSARAA